MPILIVRHAQTAGNAAGIIQTPDTPLSAAGLVQAQRLAKRLSESKINRILSSDYARAAKTASAIAAAAHISTELEPDLRERNFGDLRGCAYGSLSSDPFSPDFHPPNGETMPEFHCRARRAWTKIAHAAENTEGYLVVVTHGLMCRALLANELKLLPDTRLLSLWQNTCLTEVDSAPPWIVRRLACVAHLETAD